MRARCRWEFEISFNEEDEHTFDRKEAVLFSTAKYNSGLKFIAIVDDKNPTLDATGTELDESLIEVQRARLLSLLNTFKKRTPLFDYTSLREHIRELPEP